MICGYEMRFCGGGNRKRMERLNVLWQIKVDDHFAQLRFQGSSLPRFASSSFFSSASWHSTSSYSPPLDPILFGS